MGVSLSVETSTIARVAEIQTVIRGALTTDERETVLNGLSDISEAFPTGWQSDTDSGDGD